MKKQAIGILDTNIDNIAIINFLEKSFPYEHFIYVYDPECLQYEGLPEDEIKLRVQKNLDYLLARQVKLIITVSSTIVEYCIDILNKISIPVVNIFDSIIDEVNNSYEHKNMVLLADEALLQANIYQKNIRYNHLYPISSDALTNLIKEQKTKTSISFNTVQEVLKTVICKEVDLIIPTNVNLLLLKTEIEEYMPEAQILNVGLLLVEKTKAALLTIENLAYKKKGFVELAKISIKQKDYIKKFLFSKRLIWRKKIAKTKEK